MMKTKVLASILACAGLLTTSCEQHNWKETKQLYSHGDGHGHGHEGEHGHGDAEHKKEADSAHKADAHGSEKKEEAKH